MSNHITSLIRTYVPIGVGLAATWLAAELEVIIDAETSASLSALFVTIASAAYYTAARWLEERFPQVGWLLGSSKTPEYDTSSNRDDAGQVSLAMLVIIALVIVVLLMATGAIEIRA